MARSRRAFFLRLVDTPVAMLWYDNSRQILGFLHNGDRLVCRVPETVGPCTAAQEGQLRDEGSSPIYITVNTVFLV